MASLLQRAGGYYCGLAGTWLHARLRGKLLVQQHGQACCAHTGQERVLLPPVHTLACKQIACDVIMAIVHWRRRALN